MNQLNYNLLVMRCRTCLAFKRKDCPGSTSYAGCRELNRGRGAA